MNDKDKQAKDIGITKECRQDFLNEVKFKLKKLVLQQNVFNSLSQNIKECLNEREQEHFQLKLQFICVQTNIKLKEIITIASRNKNKNYGNQKQQNVSIQFQQGQCSLIKILCYDRQNTEQQQVLVNIYLKSLNNITSLFQHIGCIYLNLKEIKKQLNERIKYSAIHKVEVQPYYKRINLHGQKEKQQSQQQQKQKDIKNFKHQYKKNQNQQQKYRQFQYHFKPKQIQTTNNNHSYLQIRVIHSQNISQVMELFRLKKCELSKPMLKRSNMKIQTRVVNQNIFVFSQNLHNQYHLYLNQFNLHSTRSQFAMKAFQKFNTQTQNKHIQNYQQTNLNNRYHSNNKTFQQKIYELLQQVKKTKKNFEIQNYQNVKNSQQIKIKKVFQMISPRSNRQQLMSNRNKQKDQEVYDSFQTNVVNSIIPITSLPSIRHSKSEQYLNSNRNQLITSKQRYQNLYRIQKRLESHQKIAAISSRFLHKMYSDQNPQ